MARRPEGWSDARYTRAGSREAGRGGVSTTGGSAVPGSTMASAVFSLTIVSIAVARPRCP